MTKPIMLPHQAQTQEGLTESQLQRLTKSSTQQTHHPPVTEMVNAPKRPRGRPKGSKNKPKDHNLPPTTRKAKVQKPRKNSPRAKTSKKVTFEFPGIDMYNPQNILALATSSFVQPPIFKKPQLQRIGLSKSQRIARTSLSSTSTIPQSSTFPTPQNRSVPLLQNHNHTNNMQQSFEFNNQTRLCNEHEIENARIPQSNELEVSEEKTKLRFKANHPLPVQWDYYCPKCNNPGLLNEFDNFLNSQPPKSQSQNHQPQSMPQSYYHQLEFQHSQQYIRPLHYQHPQFIHPRTQSHYHHHNHHYPLLPIHQSHRMPLVPPFNSSHPTLQQFTTNTQPNPFINRLDIYFPLTVDQCIQLGPGLVYLLQHIPIEQFMAANKLNEEQIGVVLKAAKDIKRQCSAFDAKRNATSDIRGDPPLYYGYNHQLVHPSQPYASHSLSSSLSSSLVSSSSSSSPAQAESSTLSSPPQAPSSSPSSSSNQTSFDNRLQCVPVFSPPPLVENLPGAFEKSRQKQRIDNTTAINESNQELRDRFSVRPMEMSKDQNPNTKRDTVIRSALGRQPQQPSVDVLVAMPNIPTTYPNLASNAGPMRGNLDFLEKGHLFASEQIAKLLDEQAKSARAVDAQVKSLSCPGQSAFPSNPPPSRSVVNETVAQAVPGSENAPIDLSQPKQCALNRGTPYHRANKSENALQRDTTQFVVQQTRKQSAQPSNASIVSNSEVLQQNPIGGASPIELARARAFESSNFVQTSTMQLMNGLPLYRSIVPEPRLLFELLEPLPEIASQMPRETNLPLVQIPVQAPKKSSLVQIEPVVSPTPKEILTQSSSFVQQVVDHPKIPTEPKLVSKLATTTQCQTEQLQPITQTQSETNQTETPAQTKPTKTPKQTQGTEQENTSNSAGSPAESVTVEIMSEPVVVTQSNPSDRRAHSCPPKKRRISDIPTKVEEKIIIKKQTMVDSEKTNSPMHSLAPEETMNVSDDVEAPSVSPLDSIIESVLPSSPIQSPIPSSPVQSPISTSPNQSPIPDSPIATSLPPSPPAANPSPQSSTKENSQQSVVFIGEVAPSLSSNSSNQSTTTLQSGSSRSSSPDSVQFVAEIPKELNQQQVDSTDDKPDDQSVAPNGENGENANSNPIHTTSSQSIGHEESSMVQKESVPNDEGHEESSDDEDGQDYEDEVEEAYGEEAPISDVEQEGHDEQAALENEIARSDSNSGQDKITFETLKNMRFEDIMQSIYQGNSPVNFVGWDEPEPDPDPNPNPEPEPDPGPDPDPEPEPDPYPDPNPEPEPEPEPEHEPEHEPAAAASTPIASDDKIYEVLDICDKWLDEDGDTFYLGVYDDEYWYSQAYWLENNETNNCRALVNAFVRFLTKNNVDTCDIRKEIKEVQSLVGQIENAEKSKLYKTFQKRFLNTKTSPAERKKRNSHWYRVNLVAYRCFLDEYKKVLKKKAKSVKLPQIENDSVTDWENAAKGRKRLIFSYRRMAYFTGEKDNNYGPAGEGGWGTWEEHFKKMKKEEKARQRKAKLPMQKAMKEAKKSARFEGAK